MKILILEQDYLGFISAYCHAHAQLRELTAEEQVAEVISNQAYLGDSYQVALTACGHEVHTLFPSCTALQQAWADEHGHADLFASYGTNSLLIEQVRHIHPDVLYIHSGVFVDEELMSALKPLTGIIVSQWSCRLLENVPYHLFDLIISSARNFVEEFRSRGIAAEHVQHGFDERQKLAHPILSRDVLFTGTLLPDHHAGRIADLEYIAAAVPLEFYGYGAELLPETFAIRKAHRGIAWGADMLALLASARISLHLPGDAVLEDAGSKRLFEVTGMGSLLLTRAQPGLSELFEEGVEMVTFSSAADCVEKIHCYLAHEDERRAIAARGQQRTLRDHTVTRRIALLTEHLQNALKKSASG